MPHMDKLLKTGLQYGPCGGLLSLCNNLKTDLLVLKIKPHVEGDLLTIGILTRK
jgi:hypothetical protein